MPVWLIVKGRNENTADRREAAKGVYAGAKPLHLAKSKQAPAATRQGR